MAKGRKFAAFDIDGTLIRWQLYHAVADALAKAGDIDAKTYAQIRDARMIWKNRAYPESFKDYQSELVNIYEKALRKLSFEQFEKAAQAVFDEYKDQVYAYTRDMIMDLKKQGYLLFAISGSQVEIVTKIAAYYGFDDCVGTEYIRSGERFTGENILHIRRKDLVLKRLIKKHSAVMKGSIAVGDSLSDIPALEMVEMPIAFNPEARLFEHAKDKGWKVVIERKNIIFELEKRDGKYQLVKTS